MSKYLAAEFVGSTERDHLVDKPAAMQDYPVDKSSFLQGIPMKSAHPSAYYPELSDDHLRVISERLLDLRFTTLRELNSPYDDNYTRETPIFGRSRNMLIEMAQSSEFPWMSLRHAGMDITFNIGQVPCRFFRDDAESPCKAGFFKRNAVDDLFAPDDTEPVLWRFVVEKGLTEDDEDRVFFLGFNVYQERVCEWVYQASSPMLHSVDTTVPAAAVIAPAAISIREEEVADGAEPEDRLNTIQRS